MKIYLFFVLLALLKSACDSHNCSVHFSYKKICHRFKITAICQPPLNTQSCIRIKTTFQDSKCPTYSCVSARPSTTTVKPFERPTTTTTATSLERPTTTVKALERSTTTITVKPLEETTRSESILKFSTTTTDESSVSTGTTEVPSFKTNLMNLQSKSNRGEIETTSRLSSNLFGQRLPKKRSERLHLKTELKTKNEPNNYWSDKVDKVRVVSNLQRMMNPEHYSAIDCGDKQCSLTHKIMQNCIIYLHTNATDCVIPCKLGGCKTEMHHYINCPTWECNPYTTTTPSTTTSTMTTTTMTSEPAPSPSPTELDFEKVILYISLGLNLLFVLTIIALGLYIKKCTIRPRQIIRSRRLSLLPDDSRYFSLGSDDSNETNTSRENIPLLQHQTSRQDNTNPTAPSEPLGQNTNTREQLENPSQNVLEPRFQEIDLNTAKLAKLTQMHKAEAQFVQGIGYTTFKKDTLQNQNFLCETRF